MMLSVDEAQSRVLAGVQPLPAERVPLLQAFGRVLAEEIRADKDGPPFANSAMDGYAVQAADTVGAGPDWPARLRVLGDVPAGSVFAGAVAPGTAVRIMTGAVLPAGADAVVMVEYTEGAGIEVQVRRPVSPGENVRPQGEDMRAGDLLLSPGAMLGPAQVGICAAAGRPEVSVSRVPSVAVISTGDEVVAPGEPLPPGKIRNSNLYALAGQVVEAGARLHSARHAGDDGGALREALREAAGADLIVTSGGVSVGDYDLVKDVLAELGEIQFWRVAMKPGKPLTYGTLLGKPLLGLPGNPVSSMVTFELFARPALRRMLGCAELFRPQVPATLAGRVRHHKGRREFVRAMTTPTPAGFQAAPTGEQGSGILTSMLRANSLAIVPEDAGDVEPGAVLDVMLL